MENMTKKEFTEKLTALGTMTDEIARRSEIADLVTEANTLFDNNENLTTTNETLTADNENLRSANLKLFLQVGKDDVDDEPPKPDPPKPTKTFDDIIKEWG